MIEVLAGLGRTLGFSFAAGINLYATVAILGLASRYGWVSLPEQYRVFDNDLIIGIAITLYVIEFFADKIPWVDSIWDAIHTAIRPIGGAVIAVQTLGDASPAMETLVGLWAARSPPAPTSRRPARAPSRTPVPEPFSNWILSFTEDVFVVSLGFIALKYPLVATLIVLVALVLMAGVRGVDRPRGQAPVAAARGGLSRTEQSR